jgi:hypothetical protein
MLDNGFRKGFLPMQVRHILRFRIFWGDAQGVEQKPLDCAAAGNGESRNLVRVALPRKNLLSIFW